MNSYIPSSTEVNSYANTLQVVSELPSGTLTVLPRDKTSDPGGPSVLYTAVHVGGLVMDDEDENLECIGLIQEWLIYKKIEYKNNYILNQKNSSNNLQDYIDALKNLGEALLKAFNKNEFDSKILRENGWPEGLIECMNNSSISIPVEYMITLSCMTYPDTDNFKHMEKLQNENKQTE